MIAITKVSYSQKFPTGAYLNCDIGFEASIIDGVDDPKEALSTLQKLAESFHKSSFSHLYTESGKPIEVKQVEDKPELTQEEALIALIENDCKTIQLLERQRKQVERFNNERVTAAFENKLKQLRG